MVDAIESFSINPSADQNKIDIKCRCTAKVANAKRQPNACGDRIGAVDHLSICDCDCVWRRSHANGPKKFILPKSICG